MPPASAATANSNTTTSSTATNAAERDEQLRGALKVFILKDRQRKKEEYEAKVEEERIRKEREARERQNNMTLEETRGQITKLDQKLKELRNQKQQLFLQLKKVLNEDETRKKQQKDNEMLALQALQAQQANAAAAQSQVYVPPVRVHHQMAPLPKQSVGSQGLKRGRSPSPPTYQGYYKSPNYTQSGKHDDGRRGADYAKVLWNNQRSPYPTQGTLLYPSTNVPPQPTPDGRGSAIIYPPYNFPIRPGYHLEVQPATSAVSVGKSDPSQPPKPTQVYQISLDQPPISQAGGTSGAGASLSTPQKPQVTMEKISDRYHIEVKHDGSGHGGPPHQLPEGVVYASIPGLPLHPNVMQITGNPGQAGASISQGYAPGRGGSAHEQQLARQHQIMLAGQPGQPQQQPVHYQRRMY